MVLVVTIIDFVVIIVLCICCNDKSLLQYNGELELEGVTYDYCSSSLFFLARLLYDYCSNDINY